MTKYTWRYLQTQEITRIDELTQILLANRHWDQDTLQAQFSWEKFTPTALGIDKNALQKAIARIERAAQLHERVLIFGDYDVDGNCATAIMWQILQIMGIAATPFIPHRFRHGYGMSIKALEEIIETDKPDLIITVDNGISAQPALAYCRQHGIDVIVADHHQPEQGLDLPVAACVHTVQLCGAGVSWYLGWQLLTHTQNALEAQNHAYQLLDLVALATIVDQVPLVGLNRCLVKEGITQLRASQRPGIQALCAASSLKQDHLSVHDIGFSLGPRINAIGRLTNTLEALRLLCTKKQNYACKLAQTLSDVNMSRQELTTQMFALAQTQIDEQQLDKIIIVGSQDFHEGIIGLIASKLTDRYQRPAIVFALSDQLAKGSARSVEGFNITDFIRQFRKELVDAGGHAMAAGLSIAPEKYQSVTTAMRQRANELIRDAQLVPTLLIEAPVAMSVLFHAFLPALLDQLAPFGAGNPELCVSTIGRVKKINHLGHDGQHLRLDLVNDKNQYLNALVWNFPDSGLSEPQIGEIITVAGLLEINEFRGVRRPQLIARDWQPVTHPTGKIT